MFILTTDSSCDLPKKYLKEIGVPYIPLTFIIDGVAYPDDFYAKMKSGVMPTTSQISTYAFEEFFEKTANEKPSIDIVHLCLSSGVSGTYNNALSAAKTVSEKCGVKIYVVDTLAASQGLRLVM